MEDVIVILILLAIVAGIVWYFVRTKKRAATSCISCPYANRCVSKCGDERSSNSSNNIEIQN